MSHLRFNAFGGPEFLVAKFRVRTRLSSPTITVSINFGQQMGPAGVNYVRNLQGDVHTAVSSLTRLRQNLSKRIEVVFLAKVQVILFRFRKME